MPLLTRKDWTGYLVELVVVVLGILIAFQVEEWREQLGEQRELRAALLRLKEETKANLTICETALPLAAQVASSAHVVVKSLSSGRLADGDIDQFEAGLVMMGFNPRPPFVSTVADEMISTGLLKKLENEQLRTSIAALPANILGLRDVSGRGAEFEVTMGELSRSVEFDYTGPADLDELYGVGIFERGLSVRYDFDSLSRNKYLKNLLIDATDTHTDRYARVRYFCESLAQVDDLLSNISAS